MPKKVYALLVGINDYADPVPKLHGCENDVRRMEEFLRARVPDDQLVLATPMVNAAATRQAVIDAFRAHLRQAGPDDVALFYYSGHGSREDAPEAFWYLEPNDHQNETLVCFDSRQPGNYDLADKELALLIHEVATQNHTGQPKAGSPHIVLVVDSCHSGSVTRDAHGTRIRLAPEDTRVRPLDTYIVTSEMAEKLAGKDKGATDWFVLPQGQHVVLSACRAEEASKEKLIGEEFEQRGVFSYHLLKALSRTNASATYWDVFMRTRQQVINTVSLQTPQIESTDAQGQDGTFLDGTVLPHKSYFLVTFDRNEGRWLMTGGAAHGIGQPKDGETTTLALFDVFDEAQADKTIAGLKQSDAVGTARVTKVHSGRSEVDVTLHSGQPPKPNAEYHAVVISQPLPPLQVAFEGDATMLEAVRAELNQEVIGDDARLLVQEAKHPERAELRLTADKDGYHILRAAEAHDVTITSRDAETAVARLAHVARWLQIAALDNPSSQLPANAVDVHIHRIEPADAPDGGTTETLVTTPDVLLTVRQRGDGKPQLPRFKMALTNNTGLTLFCGLLDMTEQFGCDPSGFNHDKAIELAPHSAAQVFYFSGADNALRTDIPTSIPEELRKQNVDRLTDILKIIISTDDLNPTEFYLDDIRNVTFRGQSKAADRTTAPKTTLQRLMRRIAVRSVAGNAERDDAGTISDWMTKEVRLVTLWPLNDTTVPEAGKQVSLLGGDLTVRGHTALADKAKVRTISSEATRDANTLEPPPILRSNPQHVRPFNFANSRDPQGGHNAIELRFEDAADHAKVTADDPLVLKSVKPLAEGEALLMVGYDAATGMYVPLGCGYPVPDGTEIKIEHLPTPQSTGDRDLKGALTMMAYTLVGDKIGIENPFPLLRVAIVDTNGEMRYEGEGRGAAFVREQVDQAKRILLYIHGFTGDTRSMIPSAGRLPQVMPGFQDYDLILAFDYENINTRIQDTAIKLRERLAAVGLGPNHDKELHIVAHSLGTQVGRWFIECEGGRDVLGKGGKFVMLGPPNNGTPLAVMQEWLTALIGLALNGLLTVIAPGTLLVHLVRALSALVAGVEKVDTTLDQLKPDSDFYKDLNRSEDPNIDYTVIIGNTTQIVYAAEAAGDGVAKVLKSIFSEHRVHRILSLAFAHQPNDMAISLASAKALDGLVPERQPKPHTVDVNCDHIHYFSSEAGLKALAEALSREG